MKLIKLPSLVALVLTLSIASCSMKKQAYLYNEYRNDWNTTGNHSESQKLARNYNSIKSVKSITETNTDKPYIPIEKISTKTGNNNIIQSLKKISSSKNKNIFTEQANKTLYNENAITKKISKVLKKPNKNNATTDGGKSQLVALLLAIFVGILGIHRFYLGYTGIGILMLLTGGVCGILALIDLIRIIIGDLKPRYEEYTDTL